jgi:putative FmdB family regulatory protein
MPIYEYECSECGARFEQWQRIGDFGPATCPNGHSRIRRLLSQPAIIFKGSGFYATDHGRNGAGRSARKRRAAEPEVKCND